MTITTHSAGKRIKGRKEADVAIYDDPQGEDPRPINIPEHQIKKTKVDREDGRRKSPPDLSGELNDGGLE